MTFKFLEVLQFFFFLVVAITREACRFFKGICSKPQRDMTGRRGSGGGRSGGDVAGASWNDPPRICWIKSLHLDVIVPPLLWDSPPPRGDQISGWKIATCQDTRPHLESYFTETERLHRHRRLMFAVFTCQSESTKPGCGSSEHQAAACNVSSKC